VLQHDCWKDHKDKLDFDYSKLTYKARECKHLNRARITVFASTEMTAADIIRQVCCEECDSAEDVKLVIEYHVKNYLHLTCELDEHMTKLPIKQWRGGKSGSIIRLPLKDLDVMPLLRDIYEARNIARCRKMEAPALLNKVRDINVELSTIKDVTDEFIDQYCDGDYTADDSEEIDELKLTIQQLRDDLERVTDERDRVNQERDASAKQVETLKKDLGGDVVERILTDVSRWLGPQAKKAKHADS
jgi:hypothetical protein